MVHPCDGPLPPAAPMRAGTGLLTRKPAWPGCLEVSRKLAWLAIHQNAQQQYTMSR